MKNKKTENVILIASTPKGYGKKVIDGQLSQIKKESAVLKRKLAEITHSAH